MQQHVEKWVGVVAAGARRRPRRLRRRLRGQGERRRFRDVIADVFGAEVLQLALVRGPPGPRFQNVRGGVGPRVPENSMVIVLCLVLKRENKALINNSTRRHFFLT